jgi:MFS transporter, DHA1 family, tetracycline resistance protein
MEQSLPRAAIEGRDGTTGTACSTLSSMKLSTEGISTDSAFRKVNALDKKRIATLFLIVLMDTAGAATIVPLVPVYVLAQFHATPLQAGLLLAAYYAAQVLSAPWLGKLSDRFGRRPILLLSQTGTIISYLLIVLSAPLGALLDRIGLRPGVIAAGLIVIFLARILDGVTGGNVTVAQAYASDISTPEQRTRALGLIGGAFGLGFILGPALVGLLALLAPTLLVAPLLAAALASVVTLLLTVLWLGEPLRREDGQEMPAAAEGVSLAQVLRRFPVLLVLARALLIGSYMAALAGTFSLYGDRVLFAGQPASVVVRNVGLIQALLGLVMVLTQVVLIKPLVSRLGEGRLVLLGSLVQLVSAVGLFAVPQVGAVIAFMVAFGLGYGISWPSLQSLLTRLGPNQMAGRLLGVLQSVNSLALILSMVWGTFVFQTVSPQAVFAVSAGLLALAVAMSAGIEHRRSAREAAGSSDAGVETAADVAPTASESSQLS